MAKSDKDLFDRLRAVGLRKEIANELSRVGSTAGRRTLKTARKAARELRAVAEELERRFPQASGGMLEGTLPPIPKSPVPAWPSRGRERGDTQGKAGSRSTPKRRSRAAASTPATSRASASTTRPRAKTTPSRTAAKRPGTAAKRPRAATKPRASGGRAARGENKAKILESLKAGPKTAAEIARETGMTPGTASSTLTKMAGSGEVAKATRGYQLPT